MSPSRNSSVSGRTGMKPLSFITPLCAVVDPPVESKEIVRFTHIVQCLPVSPDQNGVFNFIPPSHR